MGKVLEGKIRAFFEKLDSLLEGYFQAHKAYICCKAGCSSCCEKGDYPVSELELKYLMQGFIELDSEKKLIVQKNIKTMQRGEACPFLIENLCSVYDYRPVICRVHGLAYICGNDTVKLPYCANEGKNYSSVYKDGEVFINPVKDNLDTPSLLKNFDYGEIRNLYDWLKP